MQAMKQMNYPKLPADSSIFEGAEEDYQAWLGAAQTHTPRATADMPAQLIAQGKFKEAERLRNEMQEMRLRPSGSPVFLDAALHVLRTKYSSLHERRTAFQKWYAYIPHVSAKRPLSYRTNPVLDALLQNPIIDLPLLKVFVLTNVGKGYFLLGHVDIVRDFVRLAEPADSVRFLDALYDKSVQGLGTISFYEQSRPSSNTNTRIPLSTERARARMNRMLKEAYGTAINQFCKSDRTDVAITMLQKARQRNIPVHALIYSRIIDKLESTLDTQNLSLVKQLYEDRPAGSPAPPSLRPARSLEFRNTPIQLSDHNNFFTRPLLAGALRILRRHISTLSCPNPSVLMHVVSACTRFRHPRILSILRKRAYRNTHTAMIWALAEMHFYYSCRCSQAVSLIFCNNFRMVGIPRQASHYAWFIRDGRIPDWFPPPVSIWHAQAMTSLFPVKRKMWPSSHHTALVWRACVKEVKHTMSLHRLYAELLDQVRATREVKSLSPPESAQKGSSSASDSHSVLPAGIQPAVTESPYPVPVPPSYIHDDAHFNVFVRAFGKTNSAAAARVVADMYRLGITPGVETMVSLLRSFAERRDTDKLMQLFGRMEATADAEAARGDSVTAASNTRAALPPPNLAAYLVVVKHLTIHHRLKDASDVARRMLTRLEYQLGTSTTADRLLVKLVNLLSIAEGKFREDGGAVELIAAIRTAQKAPSSLMDVLEPSSLQ
ncbi:uncharacterized protein B0H18DRAFT_952182 [Fomitopsis serialis]|uniref:uncharacterized protein n=1 Tax=Fomitopsis serialis TaxID=139415 RepID=UPI002007D576|nr:uncharacterized protein B0H18DRAFT_952182 [Neoantrodia serialis]KAH9933074.1 hypothetical protein B0H18DRAFT_952182 [Neoantrodia serialis]